MATIVTRAVKGSALSHGEMDANFNNLNDDKAELGGATFTGTVTTNGILNVGSTFQIGGTEITSNAAELNYSDGVTSNIQTQLDGKASTFRGCLVYSSTNLTYTTSDTELLWNSEYYDTDGIHSTSTNTGRLTVPAGVTKIKLTCCAQYTSSSSGTYTIARIYKNGVTSYFRWISATPLGVGIAITTPAFIVTADDYFQFYLFAQAGSGTLTNNAPNTSFAMEIIE
jgi:hypothetical protein